MADYADPLLAMLEQSRNAIARVESSGRYDAIGPATRKGDRAYGRYQVMGQNIPQWTQAALGRTLTPQEFLADQQAQDAVFNHQFGMNLQKYGNPNDAASVWFSGRPLARAGNSSDGYNTVPQYVAKFQAAMGQPGLLASAAPAATGQPAQSPTTAPAPMAPKAPDFGQMGKQGLGLLAAAAPKQQQTKWWADTSGLLG